MATFLLKCCSDLDGITEWRTHKQTDINTKKKWKSHKNVYGKCIGKSAASIYDEPLTCDVTSMWAGITSHSTRIPPKSLSISVVTLIYWFTKGVPILRITSFHSDKKWRHFAGSRFGLIPLFILKTLVPINLRYIFHWRIARTGSHEISKTSSHEDNRSWNDETDWEMLWIKIDGYRVRQEYYKRQRDRDT